MLYILKIRNPQNSIGNQSGPCIIRSFHIKILIPEEEPEVASAFDPAEICDLTGRGGCRVTLDQGGCSL